jgi:hypothetical protein
MVDAHLPATHLPAMKISVPGKFWLALLLLVSSLSSMPMASMEQSAPTVVGHSTHAHPLPPMRIGAAVEAFAKSLVPERPASPHAPPALPFVPARVAATPCAPGARHAPSLPADPDAAVPHCERLPYQSNAPPA